MIFLRIWKIQISAASAARRMIWIWKIPMLEVLEDLQKAKRIKGSALALLTNGVSL